MRWTLRLGERQADQLAGSEVVRARALATVLAAVATAGIAGLAQQDPAVQQVPVGPGLAARATVQLPGDRPDLDPAASAAARPRAAAPPVRVPAVVVSGTGVLARVPGSGPRRGTGPLRRYTVAVEEGIEIDGIAFAAAVDAVLSDPRSWRARGQASFRRVSTGPVDFRIVLASPRETDRLCAPLDTDGQYSCANGSLVVVNSMRWQRGATAYAGDLPAYRAYVVNHEVGHTLGRGHVGCSRAGAPAPVMMQQTVGVGSCRAQPWPYP